MAPRPPRDWIQIFVTALPGLAAVIALIFTWLSISAATDATNRQLGIAQQGQVTDRYNTAITNLGSSSADVRLGGIYALQRIMRDSPRDQATVVAVLCAFVRDHANAATANSVSPTASQGTPPAHRRISIEIQAALTVVATRSIAYDSSATVVDLTSANLTFAELKDAHLVGAKFDHADLNGARLTGADLSGADLTGADFFNADLIHADLTLADLTGTNFNGADLTDADLFGADLTGADLAGAEGLQTGTPRSSASSTPAP